METRPTTTGVIQGIQAAGLLPPDMLTVMITDGCNLHCGHCWPACDSPDRCKQVAVETILRIIHDFDHLGGTGITITGGEPLTHPDWFSILAFACRRTALQNVFLQTNATMLTPKTVRALAALPRERLAIQISLDGATAATHDRVRGNGSFKRTLEGLALLSAAGMQRQVCVAFTEMDRNIEDIGPLLELLDLYGITCLKGAALVKGGRSVGDPRFQPPSPAQCLRLVEFYETDSRFRALYDKIGNLAAIEWHNGRSHPVARACSCIRTPLIHADGRFYPCVMLQAPSLSVDGAHDRSLEDILRSGLPRWARLPEISRRRDAGLVLCRDCPGRDHCAGGCMGRAHAVYGDLMAADDRCRSRRAVYARDQSSRRVMPVAGSDGC